MKTSLVTIVLLFAGAALQAQSIDQLQVTMGRQEKTPTSARRGSALFATYMSLSEQYRWSSTRTPVNLDSSLFFVDKALSVAPQAAHRAKALRMRGDIYTSSYWGFTSAWVGLDDLIEAANLYNHLRDREGLHLAYTSLYLMFLAHYNLNSDLSEKALHYNILAYQAQTDPTFIFPDKIVVTTDDGPAKPETYRRAIAACEQNLAHWKNLGSKPHIMWRTEFLGDLYRKSGLYPAKAKHYEVKAARLAHELHDYGILLPCLTNLSQWELEDGDFQRSLTYAKQGLAYANQTRYPTRQATFHDRLYYTYKAMGEFEKAYAHKDTNITIVDSLARIGDQKQIMYLRAKFAAEKRQHELEQEVSRQKSLTLGLLAGALGLLALTSFIIWRNQSLHRQNKDLQTALLQGQTLERKRVAADLHDNLGSTLSSLQWSLEAIDKTKFTQIEQDVYATLSQQVSQAYKDVRLLAHNLLPDELAKQGLFTTLTNLIDKLNRNTSVRFSLVLPDHPQRMDNRIEFELYSICLELLNNTLKHANATETHLTLSQANGTVQLIVGDNGTGLDGQRKEGKGLQNVSARVEALRGTWSVESEVGRGVVNHILVPINAPARVSSQT